jgi:hypothetical protein
MQRNTSPPYPSTQNPSHHPLTPSPQPQIEWDKAAAAYGSASVESYKKGMQNSLKKIKKAMDDGVQPAEGSTPAKAANNKGGRKRKEKAASAVVVSEGEDAVVEDAPPKKKAKAKAKAAPKKSKAALKAEAEAAALAEADEAEVVKSEGEVEE